MSILSKFFSRIAAKKTEVDAIVIDRIKSFKMEFNDKAPQMVHDGEYAMRCNTSCSVIANGISMNISAIFTIDTPAGDGFTLDDIDWIEHFLPTRAALPCGTPTLVTFSEIAVVELLSYIKTHLVYERYEVADLANL